MNQMPIVSAWQSLFSDFFVRPFGMSLLYIAVAYRLHLASSCVCLFYMSRLYVSFVRLFCMSLLYVSFECLFCLSSPLGILVCMSL